MLTRHFLPAILSDVPLCHGNPLPLGPPRGRIRQPYDVGTNRRRRAVHPREEMALNHAHNIVRVPTIQNCATKPWGALRQILTDTCPSFCHDVAAPR